MTIEEAIKQGKEFKAALVFACIAQDFELMYKFQRARVGFEMTLKKDHDDNFMNEYYAAVD